jgi:hypothetical protein
MNRWAGKYGADRIVEWWTSDRKKTAIALREFKSEMRDGMSHGPLRLAETDQPDERALAAHAALVEHIGNAVKRLTNMRDEEDPTGAFLWLIGKESAHSPKKIDLAVCALLSWVARGQAVAAGVLNTPNHGRAAWGGDGKPSGGRRVDRSEYVPCVGCEKPIHPDLHKPDAPEQGKCLRCRTRGATNGSAGWR